MQYIMFTKHLEGLDVPGIIAALQSVGVSGADLCVRPGYPVNVDNIGQTLPQAAKQFADAGLSIPLVTTPTGFNRPNIDYAERYYAACAEAGVKHIKVGYWHWMPEKGYWDQLTEVREYVAGFEDLSKEYGVQTVVHNHSGKSMGLNACAAMNVVKGFDPQYIGVFADPGHLALCGEPIEMALDIVREYLSVVAFKDLIWQRPLGTQGSPKSSVVRMGQGLVDWPGVIRALQAVQFSGPVCFHSEYSGEPTESVIDLARADVRFFNRLREA